MRREDMERIPPEVRQSLPALEESIRAADQAIARARASLYQLADRLAELKRRE